MRLTTSRVWISAFAMGLMAICAAPSASAQTKVGVIDFQRAVIETAEFANAYKALEAKYKPMQDQLLKTQQEIQDIDTQLRTASGQLSSSGEAELQARGARKQRDADRLQEDIQTNFEAERNAALQLSSTRMQEVLQKLAEAQGLDMIVDRSSAPYFKAALDVTDAAVKAYDAAHPSK